MIRFPFLAKTTSFCDSQDFQYGNLRLSRLGYFVATSSDVLVSKEQSVVSHRS